MLNSLCDVILNGCWVWQVKVLSDNEQKLAKICKRVRLCHMRTLVKWSVYAVLAFMLYSVCARAIDVFGPSIAASLMRF